ncbi:hypothetical protein BT63DRAFT_320653 [Microthyrium microscopicum]|uniref:Acyltransferase 3 domain-containing protein n=1 Tax=Microthyrium microscopicum TaxID=703497 RepID=A0A6A6U6C6_9PEZI|nr:hypothetical protein BT63DRAFT_320653 [Microthyrium microscopicum]
MPSTGEATRKLFCCLVPSYLQPRRDALDKPPLKLHATSCLDGLRGVAALIVFIFHILFSYTAFHDFGYGQSPDQKYVFQLPIIRVLYAGHAMVVVFFVVGGYVFSIKPLKLIHSGQKLSFLDALVSSVFRRAIRLYMPAVIATFLTMLTVYCGLWEFPRQFITEDRSIIWYPDNHLERSGTFTSQLLDWVHETKLLSNVFTYYNNGFLFPYYPHYDPHLWTVPIEFRSSMLLALSLLGLSRCRPPLRVTLSLGTILYCILWDRWELVCFLSGSLLCYIDITTSAVVQSYRADHNEKDITLDMETLLPQKEPPGFQQEPTLPRIKRYALLFFAGLYLLSAPPLEMSSTPGYMWLSHLVPSTYTDPKRFPHTIGALLLTFALTRSPILRQPFETAAAQYLGKISFSLYIVHGPLIHMVGYSVTPVMWRYVIGMETQWQWVTGLFLGSCVLAVVVAIVADWFWRIVEGTSITWAKKFEDWCFEESQR